MNPAKALAVSIIIVACSAMAFAQPRLGRLQVTVVDQTGGVLPGAIVTILGTDETNKATGPTPVTATNQGMALFESLPLGRYAIKAEFPGFEVQINPDVRVRAGDNRHTMTLALQRIADTVTIARDRAGGGRRSIDQRSVRRSHASRSTRSPTIPRSCGSNWQIWRAGRDHPR